MSTRANIIIKDDEDELWFYRHSDGYPKGTLPTLKQFLKWVEEGKIRNNAGQAAGWLILIGAKEFGDKYSFANNTFEKIPKTLEELFTPTLDGNWMGWKCGAYEPCPPNADYGVDFIYTVDLIKKTITWKKV